MASVSKLIKMPDSGCLFEIVQKNKEKKKTKEKKKQKR
jgi:hypothetical protein